MAILVNCGGCGKQFRAKDQFRNTRLKCPTCKADVLVSGPHVCGTDVFISYSTNDKQVADAVCAAMESKNLRCWIAPRDIAAGASWGASIVEGIEDSRAMLLVFSEHAGRSDQVLREVERAVAKRKPVVPLRIDAAPMRKDFEYFLASCHWLDATSGALDDHLAGLTRTMRHLLLERAGADADGKGAATAAGTSPGAAPVAGAALVAGAASAAAGTAPLRPAPAEHALGERASSGTAAGADTSPLVPADRDSAPPRAWKRPVAALVAVLGLAAVVGAAILATRGPGPASDTRPSTAPSSSAVATKATPAPIDLLARAVLPDYAVAGRWDRRADGLASSGPAPMVLRLGEPPAGNYDLRVEFTPTVGDDTVAVVISRFGKGFIFYVGGRPGRGLAGFERRGKASAQRIAPNLGPLRNGVRHTILVRVRRNGVSAIVNERFVGGMKTNYADLELPPPTRIVGRNQLGVSTYRTIVLHSATCTPVPDDAEVNDAE